MAAQQHLPLTDTLHFVATTVEAAHPGLRTRPPAAFVGLAFGAGLSALWWLLPPTGSDLSAQVAHAQFAAAHLWQPVDLQWFGGAVSLGYSVIGPPLMGALGVRLVGALATAVSAGLFGLLISRCQVPRPRAGAVAGAVFLFGNLIVGRLTFALGVAAALTTLLALTYSHWSRWLLLVAGPLITWAASPLAALFLLLVGVALVIRRPREREGIVLAVVALAALVASTFLGQRGYMPSPIGRGIPGIIGCGVVALSTRHRLIRIGAILAALGVLLSMTVQTQVGMNALRLPALFGVPLIVATSRLRPRQLVPAVAATVLLVPPLMTGDVTDIGDPSNERAYYTELLDELGGLPLSGRVEVPPTLHRWESVYVASRFPLARGWMTQLDTGYAGIFFASSIDSTAYRRWLHANAVQYVAVPDAKPASAGTAEIELISTGLPFLSPLWRGEHWTLYTVDQPTATVTGGRLVAQDAASVTLRAGATTSVFLRIRWSPWLTLNGPSGCLRRHGVWTDLVAQEAGTYQVASSMVPGNRYRECADM